MAVVIGSSVWAPAPSLYLFIFLSCLLSLFLSPYAVKNSFSRASAIFDHGLSPSFVRFQRNFLLLYSLASVMDGFWSLFGEFEFTDSGVGREQAVLSLCSGYAVALLVGPFLGVLSDLIGPRKIGEYGYCRGPKPVFIFRLQSFGFCGRHHWWYSAKFWMLGSSIFPMLTGGSSPSRTEDFLVYGFLVAGFVLSIISYDYQELGVLVTLFCLFHTCVGLILPSLARLRTMYVPNELRGGMISFSQAPANAALLFFFLQGGYYRNIENSTIMALAALGLIISAGCMHALKRWGKQPYQNWSKQ